MLGELTKTEFLQNAERYITERVENLKYDSCLVYKSHALNTSFSNVRDKAFSGSDEIQQKQKPSVNVRNFMLQHPLHLLPMQLQYTPE